MQNPGVRGNVLDTGHNFTITSNRLKVRYCKRHVSCGASAPHSLILYSVDAIAITNAGSRTRYYRRAIPYRGGQNKEEKTFHPTYTIRLHIQFGLSASERLSNADSNQNSSELLMFSQWLLADHSTCRPLKVYLVLLKLLLWGPQFSSCLLS